MTIDRDLRYFPAFYANLAQGDGKTVKKTIFSHTFYDYKRLT